MVFLPMWFDILYFCLFITDLISANLQLQEQRHVDGGKQPLRTVIPSALGHKSGWCVEPWLLRSLALQRAEAIAATKRAEQEAKASWVFRDDERRGVFLIS